MEISHTIMYSGGLDSFLTYQYLRKVDKIFDRINLLYFNMGARCNNSEIELFNSDKFKKHVILPVVISDSLNMGDMETETAYIPNRNILAAIMTNSVLNSDRIWIGGTLSDRVNDNNKEIFDDLGKLLTKMHQRLIIITSPFYHTHKVEVIKDYVLTNGWEHYSNQQEARLSLIEATFSCYDPLSEPQEIKAYVSDEVVEYDSKECLECPACFRKCLSLYAGGIFIPMKDTNKSRKLISDYYDEAKNGVSSEKNKVMLPRFIATMTYCEELYKCWGI